MVHAAAYMSYSSTVIVVKLLLVIIKECPVLFSRNYTGSEAIYTIRECNIDESVLTGIGNVEDCIER